MFMSTERLDPCPEIYTSSRVSQQVHLELDYGKPVVVTYHTSHICSDTGRMTLREGYLQRYREAMIGLLHDMGNRFEIEPIVMGAPFLDHPRNAQKGGSQAVWGGYDYGEILPEDISEFAQISEVRAGDAAEWMAFMSQVPEASVKETIARLLAEPTKKAWGGEENDHFSANVTVAGRRHTAAFLLKGPTAFREMTPAMCGKNGRSNLSPDPRWCRYLDYPARSPDWGRGARNTQGLCCAARPPENVLRHGRPGHISSAQSLRLASADRQSVGRIGEQA